MSEYKELLKRLRGDHYATDPHKAADAIELLERERNEAHRYANDMVQDTYEGAYVPTTLCDAMRQALASVAPNHPALLAKPPSYGVWESLWMQVQLLKASEKILESEVADLTAKRDEQNSWIKHIREVANGEEQVANTDTDALAYIANYISALDNPAPKA